MVAEVRGDTCFVWQVGEQAQWPCSEPDLNDGMAQRLSGRAAGCRLPDADDEPSERLYAGPRRPVEPQLAGDWLQWPIIVTLPHAQTSSSMPRVGWSGMRQTISDSTSVLRLCTDVMKPCSRRRFDNRSIDSVVCTDTWRR